MDLLWVLSGLAILAVLWVLVDTKLKKIRADTWQAFGSRLGLQYRANDDSIRDTLPDFHLFDRGEQRVFNNVLSGKLGDVPILAVDYAYVPEKGRAGPPVEITLVLLTSEAIDLPHFLIRPQSGWLEYVGLLLGGGVPNLEEFGTFFGGDDTDFEDDPEFSRRFILRGADTDAIRALFDGNLRQHFADIDREELFCEGLGGRLLYYTNRALDSAELQEFIDEAQGILQELNAGPGRTVPGPELSI